MKHTGVIPGSFTASKNSHICADLKELVPHLLKSPSLNDLESFKERQMKLQIFKVGMFSTKSQSSCQKHPTQDRGCIYFMPTHRRKPCHLGTLMVSTELGVLSTPWSQALTAGQSPCQPPCSQAGLCPCGHFGSSCQGRHMYWDWAGRYVFVGEGISTGWPLLPHRGKVYSKIVHFKSLLLGNFHLQLPLCFSDFI